MLCELKDCISEKKYKYFKNCLKSALPQKIVSNVVFFKHHHRFINYKNPILFDEKLLILKDGKYKNNSLISSCTDKLAVREYIEQKGYKNILVGLLSSYKSVEEIEWDTLPKKFVIKCNHGSGYNIIVTNKDTFDRQTANAKLRKWMKQDYAVISSELHYRAIPHCILVEEYIETKNGVFPIDYKFFASRGKIICILLIAGRGQKKERIYVDEDFNELHLFHGSKVADYKKLRPSSFERMLNIARDLSRDFPFVRVDLYDKDGQVLFGELTFTPHGCCHDYLSASAQEWMGNKVQL